MSTFQKSQLQSGRRRKTWQIYLQNLMIGLTLGLLASPSAQAISYKFDFDAYSSGPSIYACNAGLISKPITKKVCYFSGTQNICSPNTCTDPKGCQSTCVCSGDAGGAYLMNYGKFIAYDWTDKGDPTLKGKVENRIESGASTFSMALPEKDSWVKHIKTLSFELSSELYGASYFVDICYRGPQMEFYQDQLTSNFSAFAQASATDFLATGVNSPPGSTNGLVIPGTVDGKKYTELAGLTVQAFLVCDLQGVGTYTTSNVNGKYNLTANEAAFKVNSSGLPIGGGDLFMQSSVAPATTAATDLLRDWVIQASSHAPRFCKVRYVFSETNAMGSALPNFRKWQRHGARMCTYTRIEEDAVPGNTAGEGLAE
ncbi:MAG: protease [Bdellovibrionales bacterium]|nr:protease [Bdellovibrionales bacterium]